MRRRNPLLFGRDEYKYLHQVFLGLQTRSRVIKLIQEKKGMELSEKEIAYIKRKFEEWKIENPNKLIWM